MRCAALWRHQSRVRGEQPAAGAEPHLPKESPSSHGSPNQGTLRESFKNAGALVNFEILFLSYMRPVERRRKAKWSMTWTELDDLGEGQDKEENRDQGWEKTMGGIFLPTSQHASVMVCPHCELGGTVPWWSIPAFCSPVLSHTLNLTQHHAAVTMNSILAQCRVRCGDIRPPTSNQYCLYMML